MPKNQLLQNKVSQKAQALIGQLGTYDITVETSDGKKTTINENEIPHILKEEGLKNLYAGAVDNETIEKRQAFIIRFQDDIVVKETDVKIKNELITLKELLGIKGLKAYKEAVEEECKSKPFREAVFLKSTMFYEGETWKDPFVAYVGGPSSAGKTFCTKTVLEQYTKDRPSENTNKGNYVVSVDGGVDRELSQIRQFVLQLALSKGYKGIKDLHDVSTAVKNYVWRAARKSNLSHIIPSTCVDPREVKKIRNSFVRCKKNGIEQTFIMVEADQETVKRMGENRAWAQVGEQAPTELTLKKGTLDCESKVYESQHFQKGVKCSAWMAKNFGHKGQHYLVKNDLIYVKEKGTKGDWVKATQNDKNHGLVRLSKRDFEKWQNIPQTEKNTLKNTLENWVAQQKSLNQLSKPEVIKGTFEKGQVHYGQDNAEHKKKLRAVSAPPAFGGSPVRRSDMRDTTVHRSNNAEQFSIRFEAMPTTPHSGSRDSSSSSSFFSSPLSPSPSPVVSMQASGIATAWQNICNTFNHVASVASVAGGMWQWTQEKTMHYLKNTAASEQQLSVNMTEPVVVQTKITNDSAQLDHLVLLSTELVNQKLVPKERQAVIYGGKNLEDAVMLYQKFKEKNPNMPIVWSDKYTPDQKNTLNEKLNHSVKDSKSTLGKSTGTGAGAGA